MIENLSKTYNLKILKIDYMDFGMKTNILKPKWIKTKSPIQL